MGNLVVKRLVLAHRIYGPESAEILYLQRASYLLVGLGFTEVINYSFISEEMLDKLRIPQDSFSRPVLKLANPVQEEENLLRPSLIPGMLSSLLWNVRHGRENLRLFELGRVFHPREAEELPEERICLSLGVVGLENARWWGEPPRQWDFFTFSGVVQRLLRTIGVNNFPLEKRELPCFHLAWQAEVKAGDVALGNFGQLHPGVAEDSGFDRPVFIFELDISQVLSYNFKKKVYQPVRVFLPARRDLALVISERVVYKEIEDFIKDYVADRVERVELFDIYKGKNIPRGKQSLAFTIFYHNPGNLSAEEVNQFHEQLCQVLESKFAARVRRK